MSRGRVLVVLLAGLALTPTAAFAHRRATKTEQAAILAAVVKQKELSKAQAPCQVVTISTVNQRFAALSWPARLSSACLRVAANGVVMEHRGNSGWQFVTAGSSFRCPIKGVPIAVARDLGVCR